ncbi:hypothetical protein TIFTF001_019403 [Ficus carica]|uniref:Uncharacterized protein n=1 Tax=Ficus carica TaxID=3494 RepID=A0AA88AWX2_FICCA|nr:hypothetical protein TIFTF001_019403 [Ficus carica]
MVVFDPCSYGSLTKFADWNHCGCATEVLGSLGIELGTAVVAGLTCSSPSPSPSETEVRRMI